MPSNLFISAVKSRKRGSTFNDRSNRWPPACFRRKINHDRHRFSAIKSNRTSSLMLEEEEVRYQSIVGKFPPLHHSTDDGDSDGKISITKKTLEAMENEAENLSYPTSMYRLGEALSNSSAVLFDHSHPDEGDSDNISIGVGSAQVLEGVLHKLKLAKISEMTQDWDRGGNGGQLKRKLHQLVKQDGSLDLNISNWDEAMKHLSTVLILPRNRHQEEEEEEEEECLKGYRRSSLNLRQKPKSPHLRKQIPSKAARSSISGGSSRKKHSSNVNDYYHKIVNTMRRNTNGLLVWNARAKWLQAKHISPPTREMRKKDNEERLRKGEEKKEETDFVSLRDRVLDMRISEAERAARSKEIQENKRIEEEISRREEEEEEARKKASSLLRPLTEEEESIVKTAIYGIGPTDDILARCNADSVQRRSMQCLQPRQWLNDEVIHYFYLMLANRDAELSEANINRKRSHFFKSFFLTKLFDEGASNAYKYSNVKRWSKKVPGKDIFALDKIICPCNLSNVHWACAVVYVQEKRIQFYDSMTGDGMHHMNGLLDYLKDEWRAKKGGDLPDADKWRLVPCTVDTPVQENGFDCGVFSCMFADFLSVDKPLAFSQEHITRCRKRIALSIMKGTAVD